jgi:DNA-binding XRE family transcriptional regulator
MTALVRPFPQPAPRYAPLTLVRGRAPEVPPIPKSMAHLPLAIRFGERLRTLRRARGMTQMEIAVEFGIDRTFLSDVERGRKSLTLPFLEVFALGYGLSLSQLLSDL